MAINIEFGRKEQRYKEIIEQFMRSLSTAQKMQQAHEAKLSAATKAVQDVAQFMRKSKNVGKCMREMVEEIQLRQENSKISPRDDDMSMDEIVISGKKLGINLVDSSRF